MKRILVGHDGSRQSDRAAARAFELAQAFNAQVTVVSVIPELYVAELMETDRFRILTMLTAEAKRSLAKIAAKGGRVRIKTVIRQGNPASELLAVAKKTRADLIVTGSHGRHGATKFLLGSVSSKVVDHAPCSVLVVK